MSRRISFSEQDAIHLYELALEHFQAEPNSGCHTCIVLKDRLEAFIGSNNTAQVKKTIKKSGYCNKLKK